MQPGERNAPAQPPSGEQGGAAGASGAGGGGEAVVVPPARKKPAKMNRITRVMGEGEVAQAGQAGSSAPTFHEEPAGDPTALAINGSDMEVDTYTTTQDQEGNCILPQVPTQVAKCVHHQPLVSNPNPPSPPAGNQVNPAASSSGTASSSGAASSSKKTPSTKKGGHNPGLDACADAHAQVDFVADAAKSYNEHFDETAKEKFILDQVDGRPYGHDPKNARDRAVNDFSKTCRGLYYIRLAAKPGGPLEGKFRDVGNPKKMMKDAMKFGLQYGGLLDTWFHSHPSKENPYIQDTDAKQVKDRKTAVQEWSNLFTKWLNMFCEEETSPPPQAELVSEPQMMGGGGGSGPKRSREEVCMENLYKSGLGRASRANAREAKKTKMAAPPQSLQPPASVQPPQPPASVQPPPPAGSRGKGKQRAAVQ